MSDTVTVKFGGFTTLLTVAFIVLKLCNVITWSWWWVLSPLWIPVVLIIFTLLIFMFLYVFVK